MSNKQKMKLIVHTGVTDMRKGMYKLYALSKNTYNARIGKPAFFAFCNANKTKIKILVMCMVTEEIGVKFHIIQENIVRTKEEQFEWWPDSKIDLKNRRKLSEIRNRLSRIIESYGFVV